MLGLSASANYAISEGGALFHMAGRATADGLLLWVDRTGGVEAVRTIPPNEFSTPRLSPDGNRVLVVVEGDARIYDLASGRESRVTTDGKTGAYLRRLDAVWRGGRLFVVAQVRR